MMTKYQLVFVRLETCLRRIVAKEQARRRLRLKRGFSAFKEASSGIDKRRQLACARLEFSLDSMLRACTRSLARSLLSRGFRQWRERVLALTHTELARKMHIKKVTDLQQEIVQTIKQADGL